MTTEATEIPQQVEETEELPPCAQSQAEEGFNYICRENLAEQVKCLALCRSVADEAKAAVTTAQNQITLLVKVSLLGEKLDQAQGALELGRELLTEQNSTVRELALEIFNAEGQADKHPHPAVGIKLTTRVNYDPKVALAYAMLHYPGALKLDRRAFDKIAKATPHDFVTISKFPSTAITRDLSAYLPKEEEDGGL